MRRVAEAKSETGLVDTAEALAELAAGMARESRIGIDTEFLRVRTYFPRLCLLQVGTSRIVAGVDPLSLDSLEPVLAVLRDASVTKVMHAARQDIEVLDPLVRMSPKSIFDTQLAAAFLDLDAQVGYAELVSRLCDVPLAKSQTRTNWCRRPLSAAQLGYALDDVRYLIRIHDALGERLAARGREAWLAEETAAQLDPGASRASQPGCGVRGGHDLSETLQPRLAALGEWREHLARRRDLPREWIFTDAELVAAVRADVATPRALGALRADRRRVSRFGPGLIDALAQSRALVPARVWPKPGMLSRTDKKRVDELMSRLREVAREAGIAASLLATRREVEALVLGGGARLTRGWRRELVGEAVSLEAS